ncbi:RNA polymerase sigma-70 factor, ECF subfamily [Nakamurella panacisegetis]|uniref:RNA polymerase sigma-70 factor, ECF subfamily n=1 Tax=Nakamurella panacisegetis TaxID=1090615 RepID=A0A1H0KB31_9ACTN|nr:RNA polymerase sigma factor SigJ [Nakamurella panacisegetis]SDO53157.1 RNA polymerase sigma-70 factor, ECF subfamily [Nakamurella panacisegetis]
MTRSDDLAADFDEARPRLIRIAYAVLGSRAEAQDVVSDCWSRLAAADARDPVLDVEAWATVAVARLALDALRSARLRRETYVGSWLPEPLVAADADPADRVTLDESISYALLVVLETLSPAERIAWVLHDLFGMPFAEVASTVGRTPAAVRQLAVRARAHVAARAPRVEVDRAEHDAAVAAFAGAAAGGDLAALLTVLDPDVVLTSDGGGVVSSARRPVHGADHVGRFVLGILRKAGPGQWVRPSLVNGLPGFVFMDGDRVDTVASLTVRDGRIVRLDLVRSPDKLPTL